LALLDADAEGVTFGSIVGEAEGLPEPTGESDLPPALRLLVGLGVADTVVSAEGSQPTAASNDARRAKDIKRGARIETSIGLLLAYPERRRTQP
jgi:hypothetical protein